MNNNIIINSNNNEIIKFIQNIKNYTINHDYNKIIKAHERTEKYVQKYANNYPHKMGLMIGGYIPQNKKIEKIFNVYKYLGKQLPIIKKRNYELMTMIDNIEKTTNAPEINHTTKNEGSLSIVPHFNSLISSIKRSKIPLFNELKRLVETTNDKNTIINEYNNTIKNICGMNAYFDGKFENIYMNNLMLNNINKIELIENYYIDLNDPYVLELAMNNESKYNIYEYIDKPTIIKYHNIIKKHSRACIKMRNIISWLDSFFDLVCNNMRDDDIIDINSCTGIYRRGFNLFNHVKRKLFI